MMKLLSNLSLPITILTILYLLISGNLLTPSPIIIAAQIAALALSVWARLSFSSDQFSIHAEPKDGQLLTRGPYRFIRHPMYTAALLLVWSGIGAYLSPTNLIIGLLLTILVGVRIFTEEEYLRTSYPDYAAYATRTKRIIPLII